MNATVLDESITAPAEPAKRKKYGGRKPGSRNHMTLTAKEAISYAAQELGGGKRLVEWAREHPDNEHAFWTRVYPKLLPLQVAGTPGEPMVFKFQWADK